MLSRTCSLGLALSRVLPVFLLCTSPIRCVRPDRARQNKQRRNWLEEAPTQQLIICRVSLHSSYSPSTPFYNADVFKNSGPSHAPPLWAEENRMRRWSPP